MSRDLDIDPAMGGKRRSHGADHAISELAARQNGVVSRAQLVAAGIGTRAIEVRIDRGRLHVLHRGVYAVGHGNVGIEGRWHAAVLASGPGAVLSHRSAAALWGIRPSTDRSTEVTTPRARRTRESIVTRTSSLQSDEVTTRQGIAVTTPTRTLLDLGAVLGRRELGRAINEAEVLRLLDWRRLGELLERHPRRRGTRALRLAARDEAKAAGTTRSELEHRFTALLLDAGLPRPELNAPLALSATRTIHPDCMWRGRRLLVELDGHAFHGTRAAYERDRARDRMAAAAGWRVIRITWRQLRDDPAGITRDLRNLLA